MAVVEELLRADALLRETDGLMRRTNEISAKAEKTAYDLRELGLISDRMTEIRDELRAIDRAQTERLAAKTKLGTTTGGPTVGVSVAIAVCVVLLSSGVGAFVALLVG